MTLPTVLLFAGNVAFNAAANLLMKIGTQRLEGISLATFDGIVKGLLTNWALIGGCLSYVISLGFYTFAIKNVKLSIGYPISVSCAMVLVTILSALMLKEPISITQLIGGAVILIGIFILTR